MRAVAASTAQPKTTFQALDLLVQSTIGAKLFTMTEFDLPRRVARRVYSGMPNVYPVFGEKPLVPNNWTAIVLDRQETFAANTIGEIAKVFPDHELVLSLGCESCLNLPIVIGGRVWGTLNCLDVAGHYTPSRVETAQTLKSAGTVAFLLAKAYRNQGDDNG